MLICDNANISKSFNEMLLLVIINDILIKKNVNFYLGIK